MKESNEIGDWKASIEVSRSYERIVRTTKLGVIRKER